jgi:predicted permease
MWLRRQRNARIGDEIRFHRDRLIEYYVARGMDRQQAERQASLELGNMGAIEESVRDIRGRWLDDLGKDLRYAIRTLRRNRGFATVAILTLAFGIGATTAIFTVVNAVLLRTLPVDDPDSLVQVTRLDGRGRPGTVSYSLFEHLRDRVTSISPFFAQQTLELPVTIGDELEFVTADAVSGEYFNVLRLKPAAGRLLTPADDVPQPFAPAAVITDGYWQRRFGGSPSTIGTLIIVRDQVFTVVGITPESFQGARTGRSPDLFLPLTAMLSEEQRRSPTTNSLNTLARLMPGATVAQANAEAEGAYTAFLQPLLAQIPEERRAQILETRAGVVPSSDGINQLRYDMAPPLVILMATVGLILLLACVNLSGLLLARSVARQREISIRLAIGAGRWRLVRQLLTESLVLVVVGGTCGLVLADWFSVRLARLFFAGGDFELPVTLDWRVVAFAAAVSMAACISAGLMPALQAARVRLTPTLKDTRADGDSRIGRLLVAGQFAISMVLAVVGTLFVATLHRLYAVDRGFSDDGLLVVNVRSRTPFPATRAFAVQDDLLERMRAEPGVQSASAAQVIPVGGNLWDRSVQVEGRTGQPDVVAFNVIAPDYFSTLGTPLLAGREFNDRDSASSTPVAIVNDSFARHFFGTRSAIGRRVTSVDVTYEIVGVVADAKYEDLRETRRQTMYIAWTQRQGDQPTSYAYFVRASATDPMRLAPALRRLVRDVDPALDTRRTTTYESIIATSIAIERTLGTLGGLFGVLGLLVAAVGMFGVLAFRVERRTNELGVRLALGASQSSVISLVARDVVGMVLPGVVVGGAVALALAGFASRILFEVTPADPRVFAVAASILAGTALLAAWLPAHRAAHVDPLVALRHE